MLLENNHLHTKFQVGFLAGLFCFIALSSCNNKGKIVASAGSTELRENEAYVLMKHLGYNPDSKEEYLQFVQSWCENEVFKQDLMETDKESWELVQLRGENFKGELAKFYIEEKSLMNELDTIVSEDELTKYYSSHKDEFILQDYIVKALYLKIPAGLDFKKKNIQQAYLLKNDKDLNQVNSYAKLYAENYYFDDSSWIYFSELSKDIPLTKYNIDNIVLNRTKTYFSDDNYTYFLNVIDYKLKDEAPPFDFLKDQIKNIIVSKRLQILKEKNDQELIKKLKEKHEINIYI